MTERSQVTGNRRRFTGGIITVVASLVIACLPAAACADEDADLQVALRLSRYAIIPNITYRTVNGWEGKLDVIAPRGTSGPNATLIYYHGGGWRTGSKEERMPLLLPYMMKGWTIINVEYRLSDVAKAPAAVEDARCALRWVYKNANQTLRTSSGPVSANFDLTRLVTSGTSAGGHLALIVGMAPATAGLDKSCAGDQSGGTSAPGPNNNDELKVAAIVDWFGISDVYAVLGKDAKTLGGSFVGDGADREKTARQVSPITYVRHDLPPIISIHGDSDPVVPYEQKKRLHEELERVGAPQMLITVKGGAHGIFPAGEDFKAYKAIWAFLAQYKIMPGETAQATSAR